MTKHTATIFAIKKYAIHDGPNIRTTVFFKGCPLSCYWCHNPEGIDFKIKILSLAEKCLGCRECLLQCPEHALELTTEGIKRREESCVLCTGCIEVCPALAQEATGRVMTIAEIMTEINKDLPFFAQSGGGVTFSGGEPLCQPQSLLALLQECGSLGIHRAVDTSGFAPPETLLHIAEHTDLFLYDIKHMDSIRHKQFTGVGNEQILTNLTKLSAAEHPIRVRIPLIGGFNDDAENIVATGAFVAELASVTGIDILPYHAAAAAKYRKLGQEYQGRVFTSPPREQVAQVVESLRKFVSNVEIGG